ncbi:hypothetical protein AUP68_13741 [Ilyonectria robusta]
MEPHKKTPIIGFDFGATFSKATVLIPRRHGMQFHCETMVPTILAIDDMPRDLTYITGTEQEASDKTLENFKLSLMEPDMSRDERSDRRLVDFIRQSVFNNAPSGISPTVTVSAFLKGLWDKFNGDVARQIRLPHPYPLSMAITYPSCWDEGELGRLKTAVVNAGIPTSAKYVSEQKAAMYGILHTQKAKISQDLKEGDSIIVVDCGGSTMDSALYKLKKSPAQNLAPGDFLDKESTLYGAISMDLAFEALLSETLSRRTIPASLDADRVKDAAQWYWKESKTTGIKFQSLALFNGSLTVPFPGGEFPFGINPAHQSTAKVVFLTGGFFEIASLADDIKQKLKSVLGDGLQVIVPSDPSRLASRVVTTLPRKRTARLPWPSDTNPTRLRRSRRARIQPDCRGPHSQKPDQVMELAQTGAHPTYGATDAAGGWMTSG